MDKTITDEGRKTISARSVEADLIYRAFVRLGIGESLTYEQLSAIISREIKSCRGYIATARGAALKDGIVIECVRGHGYMRANDSQCARSGLASITATRRRINVARRKLHAVCDFDGLDAEDKISHQTSAAVLGAMLTISKPSHVRKLKAHCEAGPLTMEDALRGTLKAFKTEDE